MLHSARAAVIFASALPTGSRPTNATLDAAVAAALHACGGIPGCVAAMASAYGDYPETAAPRMRWALSVDALSDTPSDTPSAERELVAA